MTTPPAQSPTVSPIEAARGAIEHTRRHLFPFRFQTWLALGFLAFLDQCGRSALSSGGNWDPGGKGWRPGGLTEGHAGAGIASAVESALGWLSDHAALVVAGSLLGFVVVAAVVALVLWINARGTFMYLDGVAGGRPEVRRAWREHASAADSYFVWRFGLALAAMLIVVSALVLSGVILVVLIRGRSDWLVSGAVAIALAPVLLVLLAALPLLVLVGVALRDFVAPLQLSTGATCGAAVGVFERLLVAHAGAFVVYLLLKIVLYVATGLLVLLVGCLTCCIGFLPVVCQTLLQPLFFFERAWSLFLLRQMGYDLPLPGLSAETAELPRRPLR